MIEELKNNVDMEDKLVSQLIWSYSKLKNATEGEKELLIKSINSLQKSLKIINRAIPQIIDNLRFVKPLTEKNNYKQPSNLESFYYKKNNSERVVISSRDKENLFKELNITEESINRLKKQKSIIVKNQAENFKAARGYLKLANKLFLKSATKLINKGHFKNLPSDLKKANIDILFRSYVAMILLTTLISFCFSIGLFLFLIFFDLSFNLPLISLYSENYLLRTLKLIWIPLILPAISFLFSYFYPKLEKVAISKKISQELPFAVIHMSAISGSGISPIEIFRIITVSEDYPNIKKEIRKVLNQINVYGYDLVTALNNVSSSTPSRKLSELLSGLSTTIKSGGDLKDFFEKRSETLLLSYRLEREKYSKTAETFMDVYISIVIAAPMILMLLLIIMSVSNFGIGLSSGQLTFLIVSIITIINIVFLFFLHINQPEY